ncbi:MAG: hypothetical protein ACOCRK_10750, partial [bacterium]
MIIISNFENNFNENYIYEQPKQIEGRIISSSNYFEYISVEDNTSINIKVLDEAFEELKSGTVFYNFCDRYVSRNEKNKNIRIHFTGIEIEDNNQKAINFLDRILSNAKEIKIDIKTEEGKIDLKSYGRPVGIIYAKMLDEGAWINVNRTLLSMLYADPSFINTTNLSDDDKEMWNLDSFAGTVGDINSDQDYEDPREKYLGSFDSFKEVRIGDVQMPIPPESISISTMSENIGGANDIIRSKTSIVSNTGHEIKQIRLPFYVQGKEQINGTKKEAIDLNNDPIEIYTNLEDINSNEDIDVKNLDTRQPDYYINGLRSLIAQFKVSPFLPIDNYKINVVNNIEAVSLQNLTISNVENYPQVLKIELIMVEFNHTVYINGDYPFKDIFDWDLFRFNYQRILEGTNMGYERGNKLPLINSIDNDHFSIEIVNRSSLQEYEDAANFLDDIPQYIEGYTEKYDESDFWRKVVDKDQLENIKEQRKKFFEMADEYIKQFNKAYDIKINSFKELYSELYKITEEKIESGGVSIPNNYNNVLPFGINKDFPDDKIGYSLLEEYYDWIKEEYEIEDSNLGNYINGGSNYYIPIEPMPNTPKEYNENDYAFFPVKIRSLENLNYLKEFIGSNSYQENTVGYYSKNIIEGSFDEEDIGSNGLNVLLNKDGFEMAGQYIIGQGNRLEEKHNKALDIINDGEEKYSYEKIEFDSVYIQDISVSYSNEINMSHVNMQTRPTHQYLGSNQIQINIEAVVDDQSDIQLINYLISHSRELNLRYSNILKSPVLKLNNSIAEIFNLDGVYIETFNDETIPNMPGASAVQLALIGYWNMDKGLESLSTLYKTQATDISDGKHT